MTASLSSCLGAKQQNRRRPLTGIAAGKRTGFQKNCASAQIAPDGIENGFLLNRRRGVATLHAHIRAGCAFRIHRPQQPPILSSHLLLCIQVFLKTDERRAYLGHIPQHRDGVGDSVVLQFE